MQSVNIYGVDKPEGRLDVGELVGSSGLMMFVYDLDPGRSSSPHHYEYEEEWLLVVDGPLVLRAPDGEHELQRGDLVRFPAGPEGAHKVMNRSDAPARTLMSRARACRPSRSTRTATRSACGPATSRTS
jgi:uncharacterized cupin superfamily protein